MKLHEAIERLLRESGKPMTTKEIADALNKNKWYIKKDKSDIIPYQIVGRVRSKTYSNLFEVNGSIVSLKMR